MVFSVEYRTYMYFKVEADSLEVALDKADRACEEFMDKTPEVGYADLSYASWEDADGKFYEREFYL